MNIFPCVTKVLLAPSGGKRIYNTNRSLMMYLIYSFTMFVHKEYMFPNRLSCQEYFVVVLNKILISIFYLPICLFSSDTYMELFILQDIVSCIYRLF